jgi:hypothetical protein
MTKIKINKKYTVNFDQIYAIEEKKWGRVWVRYIDKNNQKKIAIYKGQADQICSILNQIRVLHNLKPFFVKKEN